MPPDFSPVFGSASLAEFRCVRTASTPGDFSAAVESIPVISPFEIVLVTAKTCETLGKLNSPAYVAAPVTLSRPSTRLTAVPIDLAGIGVLIFDLRHRCDRAQRANNCSFRQLDFISVVFVSFRWRELGFGRGTKCLLICFFAGEQRLGFLRAPRLVRDAAERHARGFNLAILHVECGRDADERKSITRPVANFQVMGPSCEGDSGKIYSRDQFIGLQIRFDVWGVAGQPVKVGEWYLAFAFRTLHPHNRIERGERDAHITWIRRDALIALAQDRVDAIKSFERTAAAARVAFVALRKCRVVKIVAARSLQ